MMLLSKRDPLHWQRDCSGSSQPGQSVGVRCLMRGARQASKDEGMAMPFAEELGEFRRQAIVSQGCTLQRKYCSSSHAAVAAQSKAGREYGLD